MCIVTEQVSTGKDCIPNLKTDWLTSYKEWEPAVQVAAPTKMKLKAFESLVVFDKVMKKTSFKKIEINHLRKFN